MKLSNKDRWFYILNFIFLFGFCTWLIGVNPLGWIIAMYAAVANISREVT
jgi:hypothetical protein